MSSSDASDARASGGRRGRLRILQRGFAALAVVALVELVAPRLSAATDAPIARPSAAPLASVPMATDTRNWPDVHSYADPAAFVTRHLELDLDVDFDSRELRGSVTLDLERRDAEARELVLDTRDLQIHRVEAVPAAGTQFQPVPFRLGARHDVLGAPLHIELPAGATRVRIVYTTSPAATGLQWLEPAQTHGKRLPFLYSQAQSLHARSFVPLQDTPRVRTTYAAELRVPRGLVAVMAAESDPANRRGERSFRFRMPQPVPSYLIALAVGDLEFKPTGPRTGVWAEPGLLTAAAWEFGDATRMLEQSEKDYGPYRWGRYDVLVLPPSFPYGGMENPRLTFMTPTLLAGDKSLVGVLAHELAHSWSGNLVTNATWRDGWLNEGFTTYFERRIMEAVYGDARARMEWGVGMQDLRNALSELTPAQAWQGALAPDLAPHIGNDGSSVAYEKGALFLYQLERRCGRTELDAFLQGWFDRHAFTSVTTPQFVGELLARLAPKCREPIDAAFLRDWIDEPGMPATAVLVQSDAFERVGRQREAWEKGTLATAQLATVNWSVQEWLEFLNGVTRPQDPARLAELDRRFDLTGSHNAEVAHAWYRLAIASRYAGIEPALERYLLDIGRIKLIKPLYQDLVRSGEPGASFARRVYAAARPGYQAAAQRSIDRVLASPGVKAATD